MRGSVRICAVVLEEAASSVLNKPIHENQSYFKTQRTLGIEIVEGYVLSQE